MLKIARSAVKAPLCMPLMHGNRYYLLDHKKMDDLKSKLYEDRFDKYIQPSNDTCLGHLLPNPQHLWQMGNLKHMENSRNVP